LLNTAILLLVFCLLHAIAPLIALHLLDVIVLFVVYYSTITQRCCYYLQAIMVEYWQKLHSLQVHARFFKMIQMDMVVTLKNIFILIFE